VNSGPVNRQLLVYGYFHRYHVAQSGYDVVMQMSCRDRNRIALQGDLLGAAALGVKNVLCLTGDGVQVGDQPGARPVFDLDSITLLRTARILRDKGTFLSGRPLDSPPRLFLGAASNPFAPPYDFRPIRLGKKVDAGADFVQTQFCFDLPRLRTFMSQVRDMGLDKRVYILVGVGPLRSAKTAEWMRTNVPGVSIPDEIISRLRGAPKGQQRREGKRICTEIIQQVRETGSSRRPRHGIPAGRTRRRTNRGGRPPNTPTRTKHANLKQGWKVHIAL
jgi:5,10-methylenetetrahydrofolate reductase